jgi:hypothetical protein
MNKERFDPTPKPDKKGNRTAALIYIALFCALLSAGGVLFFVFPKNEVSEVEKRALADKPEFSKAGFWSGDFMVDIDNYVGDHFPFREQLVDFSFKLKRARGIQNEKEAFYEAEQPVAQEEEKKELEQLKKDTATALKPNEDFVEEKVEKNKGVLIYNGRALQIFGGSEGTAKAYAEAINAYHKELEGIVNIWVTVVPSAGEFYMPRKYEHLKGKEKANIQIIYSHLAEGVNAVDAYSVLADHQDEYLYFRTDHHWTGLAAYYAYSAWCKKARKKPVPLSDMEHKEIPKFLGSLYHLTTDPRLAENADTVHYWKVPGEHSTIKFIKTSQFKEVPASLWAEMARGANSYSVFLGADWPLMVCKTPLNNGRRAIVIKNSYGNPYSTYFSAHFETLLILDYRYCERGITSLIKEYGITDLIFLNGAFSANTPYHIQRIRKMLHGSTVKVVLEKPATTIDSTNTNPIEPVLPDTSGSE